MSTESIFVRGEPYFYTSALAAKEFADLFLNLLHARPTAVVRVLRGGKSAARSGFFDEAAAALQFPYYFGNNWHAFMDCITSLWIPGDATVLLISDAHLFLRDEPARTLGHFVQVIADANAPYVPKDGSPTYYPNPVKVIFQLSAAEQSGFLNRLADGAPHIKVALVPLA